jgi:predicted enzyme related to lactoylglutathione lyase
MKKLFVVSLIISSSFYLGFAYSAYLAKQEKISQELKRVTGIGGIFFKCKDPKALREWYQTHLGLNTNQYGAVFEWYQGADSTKKGFSQWSPFKETSKYFLPSTKEFMINYRVAHLEKLLIELKNEGITITDTMQSYEYGKFVHIMDLEGNKIELWEPNDVAYELMGKQIGAITTK